MKTLKRIFTNPEFLTFLAFVFGPLVLVLISMLFTGRPDADVASMVFVFAFIIIHLLYRIHQLSRKIDYYRSHAKSMYLQLSIEEARKAIEKIKSKYPDTDEKNCIYYTLLDKYEKEYAKECAHRMQHEIHSYKPE